MSYSFKLIDTPVGQLKLVAGTSGLAGVLWVPDKAGRVRLDPLREDRDNPVLIDAQGQLQAYFAGKRTGFELSLEFNGTPFQKMVWHALLTIPYGETRTYRDIAIQIGHPAAMRAVGAANGRNPISIIAPCHRVIGASGALTGFAGGLQVKQQLLSLEGWRSGLKHLPNPEPDRFQPALFSD
ncbi:methylated-DNA--[protein]-cysteine S-methyltransferase [Methylobacillus caricis]|uniref:methylated-DNA--[protein]-cysteine S-methyltransferase n=1 Tax=Methylobacillus caricis TaxID=1971611 RepID=UPI0021F5C51E|nr:methylated-DNA--[protein]-cysteine S-methyltransferase [Methylobacillus caricis]